MISIEQAKEFAKNHFKEEHWSIVETAWMNGYLNGAVSTFKLIPIKNAPKDRPLLLLSAMGTIVEGSWVHGEDIWINHWTHDEIKPTHYQDLPKIPLTEEEIREIERQWDNMF